jgi:DNA-binding CsgD family transcriptional regulator
MLRLLPVAALGAATMGSSSEAIDLLTALDPYLAGMTVEHLADHYDLLARQQLLTETTASLETALKAVELRRKLGDPVALGHSLMTASRIAWDQRQAELSSSLAGEAMASLDPVGGEDRMHAYSASARLAARRGDHPAAIELARRALELGGGEASISRVEALMSLGSALGETSFPDGIEEMIEAYQLAEELGLAEEQARAAGSLSVLFWRQRDLDQTEHWIRNALAVLDSVDTPILENWLRNGLAWVAEARGDWDQGVAIATETFDTSVTPQNRVTSGTLLARVQTRRGGPDAARLTAEMWALVREADDLHLAWEVASIGCELGWLGGDVPTQILDDLDALLDDLRRQAPGPMFAAMVMWLHLSGRAVEAGPEIPAPWRTLIEGRWREAAGAWESLGMPYERAVALSMGDVGARLTALKILDDLGALPLATKIRRQLQAEGIKGVPRGPYRGRRASALGLTPRQSEILALLVERLSNAEIADRLFLSVRTVEQHVSSILTALDASTRQEAVRLFEQTRARDQVSDQNHVVSA